MSLNVLCDAITSLEGSVRPALYLSEDLANMGYDVTVISPVILPGVGIKINRMGIKTVNLNVMHLSSASNPSLLWLEMWVYEALFSLNSKRVKGGPLTINFSHVIFAPSNFWYLQGPPSMALRDISGQFSPGLRSVYRLLKPLIEHLDRKSARKANKLSPFIIANSRFCAYMYSKLGLKVHSVIYPPLDTRVFHPSTGNPSGDYILTYFGKETKFTVIKRVADLGVKIKAFGSKTSFIDRNLLRNPNIEFLGRISISDLVDAYSNALFTLFPFTHEPFGYIPLESMACGTPTLTYRMQGPGEYIVDGESGWLVDNDEDIIRRALELWRKGYPTEIRKRCVERAKAFDRAIYVKRWLKLLNEFGPLGASNNTSRGGERVYTRNW